VLAEDAIKAAVADWKKKKSAKSGDAQTEQAAEAEGQAEQRA
jgi:hypothetical protein